MPVPISKHMRAMSLATIYMYTVYIYIYIYLRAFAGHSSAISISDSFRYIYLRRDEDGTATVCYTKDNKQEKWSRHEAPSQDAPIVPMPIDRHVRDVPLARMSYFRCNSCREPVVSTELIMSALLLASRFQWRALAPELLFPLQQLSRASCKHRIVCASFILGFHGPGAQKERN